MARVKTKLLRESRPSIEVTIVLNTEEALELRDLLGTTKTPKVKDALVDLYRDLETELYGLGL